MPPAMPSPHPSPTLHPPKPHDDGALSQAPAEMVYTISLINDLAELRRMSEWLERSGRALGIAPQRLSELELCANEAVTNVISYAYDAPGARRIGLRLARSGEAASLTLEDDGKPFDPTAAALPVPPVSLEQAQIGGLGIKLIRSMMAHCAYRRGDGKNLFTMTTHA